MRTNRIITCYWAVLYLLTSGIFILFHAIAVIRVCRAFKPGSASYSGNIYGLVYKPVP